MTKVGFEDSALQGRYRGHRGKVRPGIYVRGINTGHVRPPVKNWRSRVDKISWDASLLHVALQVGKLPALPRTNHVRHNSCSLLARRQLVEWLLLRTTSPSRLTIGVWTFFYYTLQAFHMFWSELGMSHIPRGRKIFGFGDMPNRAKEA